MNIWPKKQNVFKILTSLFRCLSPNIQLQRHTFSKLYVTGLKHFIAQFTLKTGNWSSAAFLMGRKLKMSDSLYIKDGCSLQRCHPLICGLLFWAFWLSPSCCWRLYLKIYSLFFFLKDLNLQNGNHAVFNEASRNWDYKVTMEEFPEVINDCNSNICLLTGFYTIAPSHQECRVKAL